MVEKKPKKKKKHVHAHKHERDIHLHEHRHDGVKHVHPHFHEKTVHVHPHEHEVRLIGHEHAHPVEAESRAHAHVHTYSFERYAHLVSPVHTLDARIKLICMVGLVIAIVLTPPLYWERFLVYLAIISSLLMLSRLPIGFVLKRSLVILPFVLLVALFIPFLGQGTGGSYNLGFVSVSRTAPLVFVNLLIKAWLSILVMILLSASTPFALLLKGLEELKVPAVFIALLSFIYRYAAVIQDELTKVKRARDSRGFGGAYSYQLKVIGQMLGSFFIRSYERSERVYQAMAARGFDGTARTLERHELSAYDLVFGAAFAALLVFIQTWRH